MRGLVEVIGQLLPGTRDLVEGRSAGPGSLGLVDLWEALHAATQRVAGVVVTLVLDDVHYLHDRAARHVVCDLVEHPPEDLRVVLISRSKPRLGLERARLRGDLVEIVPGELRFRRAEIDALISSWTGRHVDPAEVEQATLGWAAGLRLAQLEASRGDSPVPALQEPDGVVGEYVTEELIESSSRVLRSFLDVTCWLPMVTEPLYAAIAGGADDRAPGRAELEALPIVAVASSPGAFRYPPILSGVLQQQIFRRGQAEVTRARRRAAEACHQAGELMTSMRLFLEAGCPDEAADVCADVAAENESALRAVDALVRGVPDSMPDSARWLPWRMRVAVAAGRIDEALGFIEHADRSVPSVITPGRGDCEDLLVARAAVAEHLGDVTALLSCADRILAPVERFSPGRAGTDAHRRSASGESRSTGDRSMVGRAYGWQIRALVWSGDTDRARETLRTLDQAGDHSPPDTHADLTLALLQGAAHGQHNQLTNAVALLHEAHTIARAVSHQVISPCAASELARCRHAAGASMDALELVVSTRAQHGDLPYTVDVHLRGAEVLVRLHQGDVAGAQAVVRDAPGGVERQLLAARVALHQTPAKAGELLDAIDARTPRQAVDKLLLYAQLPGLERQDASTALLQAISAGGLLGLVRTFLDEGPAVTRRLPELALEADDRALGRLAALACQELALAPTREPAGPIEPLTPRELAVLRMLPLRMSNREMAAQTYVSVNTLKTHIRAIYRKLGVPHRSEAVRRAKALQLV
ncbi:MAG: LuxR C-terminal-related transcriptional regulator [Acidimicrobiales bacterium]